MDIVFKRRKEIALLANYKNNGRIKVIEGLRQVGKSYLLKQLYFQKLIELGIDKDEIAVFDFLGKERKIRNEDSLFDEVEKRIVEQGCKYVFMDEIQLVDHFGNALKSLQTQYPGVDIYVTGSNSKTLSKDIQREIGTEYSDEIAVHPLTFSEILEDYPEYTCALYKSYGGIPKIVLAKESEKTKLLSNLYENAYLSDVLDRTKDLTSIGEGEKKRIIKRVFDSVTTGVSLKAISKEIMDNIVSSEKDADRIHSEVDTFIDRILDSFLFERVEEISLSKDGKKNPLEKNGKYYCEDLGILRTVSTSPKLDSATFENMVFLSLFNINMAKIRSLKFDYEDSIEKKACSNREIDFYVSIDEQTLLIQPTLILSEGENYNREVHNLIFSPKEGRRIVVTEKDNTRAHPNDEGIEFFNFEDLCLLLKGMQ